MSVQVKTPTKPQFEHLEIQCGDSGFSSLGNLKGSKDDIALKSEPKFSQPWNRRRRYSQSFRRDETSPAARRKRLKSSPYMLLPNKFLNGGSIEDPLNLNSLNDSELGRFLNSATPQTSPMPTPVRRESVEVRIPLNITDPLNLNDSDEDADLEKLLKKRKQRHNRHKKKEDGHLFSPPKNMDKNLMEALKIDVEPESHVNQDTKITPTPRECVQKQRNVINKIVSPVIPQTSPKVKKKRRTFSDGKPEPSSSVSKSILSSSLASCSDKKTPPKHKHPKFKQPPAQGNTSMQNKNVPKFIYGNYNRYYGYRNPASEKDHRIECFKQEWFEGKSVLDIGCNVGHLTLSIAREFLPSKIVGIDIDHKLIQAARKNVRYYMSSEVTDMNKFPVSNMVNYGPIEAPPVGQQDTPHFPNNVHFMQGNFVLENDQLLGLQKEEYDTIMALSVTKWIHFNWGDEGLKRFFKRIYRQLKPGGKLILEPQPWSSYKKKKKLTDKIFENFKSIKLRPEQFNDYLLSREIGFSTGNTVDVPVNYSKGFRRPILVFTKSETVQNSPHSEAGSSTPSLQQYMTEVLPDTTPSEENQASLEAFIADPPPGASGRGTNDKDNLTEMSTEIILKIDGTEEVKHKMTDIQVVDQVNPKADKQSVVETGTGEGYVSMKDDDEKLECGPINTSDIMEIN